MSGRSRWRLLALLCGIGMLVASLGVGPAGASPAKRAKKVDKNGELVWALPWSFQNLDPTTTLSSGPWLRPLYEKLVDYKYVKGTLTVAPEMAESYDVSDDQRTITFTLKKGIKFQDGYKFKADSVKASLERVKTLPESTNSSLLDDIESIEVVDDYTVKLHLGGPTAQSVLATLLRDEVGAMISAKAIASGQDLKTEPAGSGPYKLVRAQQNSEAVYTRWDGYRRRNLVWLKQLTIKTLSDGNVVLNGMKSGTIQGGWMPSNLHAEAARQAGWASDVVLGGPFTFLMNTDKPPFDDLRARQAVDLIIPRKELNEVIMYGQGKEAYQAFNPGLVGFDESLEKDRYDVAKAKQLAEASGLAGSKITILAVTTSTLQQTAEIMQQALKEIGVEAELVSVAQTASRPEWQTGNYDASVNGIQYSIDPAATLDVAWTGGFTLISKVPAELQAMADAARQLTPGTKKWEDAYTEINRWLTENLFPQITMVHSPYVLWKSDRLSLPKRLQRFTIVDQEFIKVGILKSN